MFVEIWSERLRTKTLDEEGILMSNLGMTLVFHNYPANQRFRDLFAGRYRWHTSGQRLFAYLPNMIDRPCRILLPPEMVDANPAVSFAFVETSDYLTATICAGITGKPVRGPYRVRDRATSKEAHYSVPNNIVVAEMTATDEDGPFSLDIVQYGAKIIDRQIDVTQANIGLGLSDLTDELKRFELVKKVLEDQVSGRDPHFPIYYDESDRALEQAYARIPAFKCPWCSEYHYLKAQKLLEDREGRLLLVRNIGNPQTIIGLPKRFCPTQQ